MMELFLILDYSKYFFFEFEIEIATSLILCQIRIEKKEIFVLFYQKLFS